MSTASGRRTLTWLFAALAVVFIAAAVFFATVRTSFLASSYAVHYKHAIVFLALAVLSLIAANITRRRA